ncbi:hypothetical protein [Shewanella cyperi]|uniref:hypothetical protein n=1 Tax=Shewanella cyperi TaxID=2814292 RepID=UPI001A94D320|nr:hypothetical protein [Shewanella cyperi]QSX42150.1 hypothetical protein JYB84_07000 [Shewanella cyperi]
MNTQTQFSDLYSAFSGYPLKSKIEGCPHCELQSADDLLHKNDLTQLAWDDLQLFIAQTMTTFGDVDDFKHFLPRIFELYITDYWNAPYDFGLFLSKLEYGGWTTWPQSERESVIRLFDRWVMGLKESSLEEDRELLEDIVADIKCYEVKFVV